METTELLKAKRDNLHKVDPRAIVINMGDNPRFNYGEIENLMHLILDKGLEQPVKVQRIAGTDTYRLIHGFRRMAAINKAFEMGLQNEKIAYIPVMFVAKEYSKIDSLIDHFALNTGKPLEPLEEAEGIKQLYDAGLKPKDIAPKIRKTLAHISNMLLLSKVNPEIKELIKNKSITSTMVVNLVRETPDVETQMRIIRDSLQTAKDNGKTKITPKSLTGSTRGKNPMTILSEAYDILAESEGISDPRSKFLEKLINNLNKKVDAKLIVKMFKNI